MRVLLLNAGSSSLKCTLIEAAGREVIEHVSTDWAGRAQAEAVGQALDELPPGSLAAVGHRIVHGGEFRASVRITPELRARIRALADLAPLHNPPGLETLAAAQARLPDVPHVAVFDTAFHSDLPAAARTYPLPARLGEELGIRRYGFHGLSHAYCARRAAELLGRPLAELRLVICHLGHGCSAAAVRDGRSIDTTMGFTPLEGLMMGTRSGSLDPGALLHLLLRHGIGAKELEHALQHESGLLGVSGVSADMREVLAAARAGHERARLAIDVYAHRIRQAIGALTATLGGVDALVFTGGVGENSPEVREASCVGLECLGLALDRSANSRARPDADIAQSSSRGRILMIATREDLTMLDEVVRVIEARA
jgi:acetate kinase